MKTTSGSFSGIPLPSIGYAHFLDDGGLIAALGSESEPVYLSPEEIAGGRTVSVETGTYVSNLDYNEIRAMKDIPGVRLLPFTWARVAIRQIYDEWNIQRATSANTQQEREQIATVVRSIASFMNRIFRFSIEMVEDAGGSSKSRDVRNALQSTVGLGRMISALVDFEFTLAHDLEDRSAILDFATKTGVSVRPSLGEENGILAYTVTLGRADYAKEMLGTPLPRRNAQWFMENLEEPVLANEFVKWITKVNGDKMPVMLVQVRATEEAINSDPIKTAFYKQLILENSMDGRSLWLSLKNIESVHTRLPLYIEAFVAPDEEIAYNRKAGQLLKRFDHPDSLIERESWSFGVAAEGFMGAMVQNKVRNDKQRSYEKTVEAAYLSIVDKTHLLPLMIDLFANYALAVTGYMGNIRVIHSTKASLKNIAEVLAEHQAVIPMSMQTVMKQEDVDLDKLLGKKEVGDTTSDLPESARFRVENRASLFEIDTLIGEADRENRSRSIVSAGHAARATSEMLHGVSTSPGGSADSSEDEGDRGSEERSAEALETGSPLDELATDVEEYSEKTD